MGEPRSIVEGDIIVREFSGRYLIWRVRDDESGWIGSRHEGLGQKDDRDDAISRACEVAADEHAVWFCDRYTNYRRIH